MRGWEVGVWQEGLLGGRPCVSLGAKGRGGAPRKRCRSRHLLHADMNLGLVARVLARVVKRVCSSGGDYGMAGAWSASGAGWGGQACVRGTGLTERLEVLDVCHGESLECLRAVGAAGLGVDR